MEAVTGTKQHCEAFTSTAAPLRKRSLIFPWHKNIKTKNKSTLGIRVGCGDRAGVCRGHSAGSPPKAGAERPPSESLGRRERMWGGGGEGGRRRSSKIRNNNYKKAKRDRVGARGAAATAALRPVPRSRRRQRGVVPRPGRPAPDTCVGLGPPL